MMARRLARVLVRAYPVAFRARHGQALAQVFAEDWRRDRRWRHRTALVANMLAAGIVERRLLPASLPQHRGGLMTGFSSDIVNAWRSLVRRPLFTAVTVATLAIGLGATIAMFTVADAVLLRPLPFPADRELVVMTERQAARNLTGASFPAVNDWRAFPELAAMAIHETSNLLFQQGDTAERLPGVGASPAFFTTLGVSAALGSTMLPGMPELDPDPKIVLSHDVWLKHFEGDNTIIGRAILLEGKSYTVIGVMPQGFAFPSGAKFWTTLPTSMSMVHEERSLRFLEVIARLKPAAEVSTLQARLRDWKQRTAALDPTGAKWLPEAVSLRDDIVGQVRRPLQIVFIGVGFLLLVACANASALVLAHGRSKLRDLTVQSSLGASRARLIRQIVLEGLILSLAGSAVAVLIALVTRDAIVALSENQIPRVAEIAIGWRTAFFTMGAGIVTTMLVSLAPAVVLTGGQRVDLKQGSRSTTSSAGRRWFGPLIAVEFALALMLASAAGLLVTSYRHLSSRSTGFVAAQVLTAKVDVPLTRDWSGDLPRRRLNAALLDNLRAQPGVRQAAIITRLPLSDVRGGTDLWATDDESRKSPALLQLTSEGYFDAMGSRILEGRDFAPSDIDTAPPVAIINDVLAKTLWPADSAIGRKITYQFMRGPSTVEIVGVVPAMRYNDFKTEVRPEIYVSFRQALNTPAALVVKTSLDPSSAAAAARAALNSADVTHSVTLSDISTLDAQRSRVLAQPRFYLVMVGVFAVVAGLLAALGIYGTMMFWIGERWREFGIRIALGAKAIDVASLLLAQGLKYAGLGLAMGLAAAVAGRQIIAGLLFRVAPADPIVLGSTIVVLATAAFVASLLPARKIARVDPVTTLRAE